MISLIIYSGLRFDSTKIDPIYKPAIPNKKIFNAPKKITETIIAAHPGIRIPISFA